MLARAKEPNLAWPFSKWNGRTGAASSLNRSPTQTGSGSRRRPLKLDSRGQAK